MIRGSLRGKCDTKQHGEDIWASPPLLHAGCPQLSITKKPLATLLQKSLYSSYKSPPRIGLWLFRFILFYYSASLGEQIYAEGLLDTKHYVRSFSRSRIPSAPRLRGLSSVIPMPAFILDSCLSLHLPSQASVLAHVPSLHHHPPRSFPPVVNINLLLGSKDHPVLCCQSALAHPSPQELPV